MTKSQQLIASALSVVACALSAAPGAVITSSSGDRFLRNNGVGQIASARVGFNSATAGGGRNAAYAFELPAAEGPAIAGAHLRFSVIEDQADGDYQIDLYGLNARPSAAMTSADYFAGALDTTDATRIADDLIGRTHDVGDVHTRAGDDLVLASYLTAQYGPGFANAGRWVILRLSPDTLVSAVAPSGVNVPLTFQGAGDQLPTLTITFVPEPRWIGLASCFGVLLRRGRRAAGAA